jgi:hypothetical protein
METSGEGTSEEKVEQIFGVTRKSTETQDHLKKCCVPMDCK